MKKYGLLILGAAALTTGLVSFNTSGERPSRASSGVQVTWGKIGQSTVEPTDKGMSTLLSSSLKPLHAIKFRVVHGGVNIHKCEIWFKDGSKKEVELRNDVPEGAESREITLSDSFRQVSKVIFWYDTRNYKQKAEIELWGKRLA